MNPAQSGSGGFLSEIRHKNIALYYLNRVLLASIALTMPQIVIVWRNAQLSVQNMMEIDAAFSITIALVALAGGPIADRLGRRLAAMFGSVVIALGIFLHAFGHSYRDFLIAEITMGMGCAFVFSSEMALIYDGLKTNGQESWFRQVRARAMLVFLLCSAIFAWVGIELAHFGERVPLQVAGCIHMLVLFVIMAYEETRTVKSPSAALGVLEVLRSGIKQMLENRRIAWLVTFAAFMLALNQAGLILYEPFFKQCGIRNETFGVIFLSFNLFAAIASWNVVRLEKIIGMNRSLELLCVILVLGYLLAGISVTEWSIVFLTMLQFNRAYGEILMSDYLNKEIGSGTRATSLSIQAVLFRLIYVAVVLPLGWIADHHSASAAILIAGLIAVVGASLLLKLRPAAFCT